MATTNEEALAAPWRGCPGWRRHGDSIWKTYQFDDFDTAALFVGRVADATAGAGHQPDIAIRGGRVTLELVPRTGTTLTADDLTVRPGSSSWWATTTTRSAGRPPGTRAGASPASSSARWARPARRRRSGGHPHRPGTRWPGRHRRATIQG